jgi:hypothetical protein
VKRRGSRSGYLLLVANWSLKYHGLAKKEASLPLVHFVGVLGIHSYNLVYQTAYTLPQESLGLYGSAGF